MNAEIKKCPVCGREFYNVQTDFRYRTVCTPECWNRLIIALKKDGMKKGLKAHKKSSSKRG